MNDTAVGNPANVLVIEDSPMIRDSLVDIINADPGRRVTATTDTEQGAIDIVKRGNVHIVQTVNPVGIEFRGVPGGREFVEGYLDTTSWLVPPVHRGAEHAAL